MTQFDTSFNPATDSVVSGIGLGLDVLSLIGSTYDNWKSRKDAEKAYEEQKREYYRQVATEAQRHEEEVAQWQKTFNLNRAQVLHKMEMDEAATKDAKRVEKMAIQKDKVNRWMQMVNDPTNRNTFLSIMKGGR